MQKFTLSLLCLLGSMQAVFAGAEELLARAEEARQKAKERYETARESANPNGPLKEALEFLIQAEEPIQRAVEAGEQDGKEWHEALRSLREMKKLCRESMTYERAAVPPPPTAPSKAANVPAGDKGDALTDAAAALKDPDPAKLCAALSRVAQDSSHRLCTPAILRLREESDPQARACLIGLLQGYPPYKVAGGLRDSLQACRRAGFLQACIQLLEGRTDEKSVAVLATIAFTAELRAVRTEGIGALAQAGEASLPAAGKYLRHPVKTIRTDAIAYVASVRAPASWSLLTALLLLGTDQELKAAAGIDCADRERAVQALISAGEDACPALLAGLAQPNLKKWSAFCLKKISGKDFPESDRAAWTGWWRGRSSGR